MGLYSDYILGTKDEPAFFNFLDAVLSHVALGSPMNVPYMPKMMPVAPMSMHMMEPDLMPEVMPMPMAMPMMPGIDPILLVGAGVGLVIIVALVLRR